MINDVPEEISCPIFDMESIFNITCSSISIAWDIPEGQTFDHYQLWYGPLDGVNDPENPDIFVDDITLFENDIPGDDMQAVIGGLTPETDYLFYVIGVGENNSTGWCDPIMGRTIEEGCDIPLDDITLSTVDSNGNPIDAVSYTHLTLPTNREV